MTRFFARGAGALLLCLSAGCGFMQRQAFRELDIVVKSAVLVPGVEAQRLELHLLIYNPNNYRLDASRIRYKAFVDSVEIASGIYEQRITIGPKDSTTVRAPVDFDGRMLLPLMIRLALRGSLPFELSGDLRIETAFGSVTRPFVQKGTYDGVRVELLKKRK